MTLSLRPHQEAVVKKLSEGFRAGHRCQLLYAPTGFGKTETAISIMKKVADNYKKTAMIMDRVVLVEQTSARLSRYGIDHGVMQADHWRHRPHLPIQICSAQTLEKRKIIPDINLLIIDECHVQRAGIVKLIKANPKLHVIGLTATPFTKGLGDVYTHVVGASPTGELIENGWLCPLKVFAPAKQIDMTGAKRVAGEWSSDDATARSMQITGDIVAEWVKRTHEIFGEPKKTIVFCSGVDHGRDLEAKFKEAGYNFVSISYKEDDDFKRQTISEFSKPDTTIHGLIATDILTRGFDVPDVMIGVSARPFSKSFSSHVQQLGRIMRPYPDKKFGVWLDHAHNFLRFKDDWDKVFERGVETLDETIVETAKKEPTEREKKSSFCPACGGLWTSKDNICDECGHERKSMKELLNLPGELLELEMIKRAKTTLSPQEFYAQCNYYCKLKNHQAGYAKHLYKAKFGVWPRNIDTNAVSQPTEEVLRWIKHRNLKYAKSLNKR